MVEICLQSHLYLAFFGHVRALIHWGTCLEMCNFTKFSVCVYERAFARVRATKQGDSFQKKECFLVFVAYPSQNVVKTRTLLDKSVSVAPDFVAYLTCQPCLCKQTLPCRVTRVSRAVPSEKKSPHRESIGVHAQKRKGHFWNRFVSDIVASGPS